MTTPEILRYGVWVGVAVRGSLPRGPARGGKKTEKMFLKRVCGEVELSRSPSCWEKNKTPTRCVPRIRSVRCVSRRIKHCTMYLRLLRVRRSLPCGKRVVSRGRLQELATAAAAAVPASASAASDRYGSSHGASGAQIAAVAALACLAAWDDAIACDRENIVWVDAHGKKVGMGIFEVANRELRC